MEAKGKEYTKLRFGTCLMKIINLNKVQAKANEDNNVEDLSLVHSLRKLAAASTVDFSTVQRIASGKKNAAWSTTVLIAEGLGMSLSEWGDYYDKITDKEIAAYQIELLKSKKERSSKKKSGYSKK